MTLEDLYQTTINNMVIWNYYHEELKWERKRILFSYDYLNSYIKCKDFINNYLHRGGKGNIPFTRNINELQSTRIKHIVSGFFLGIGIYLHIPKVRKAIEEMLPKTREGEDVQHHFSYLWFLTCLFHDLGYAVENHETINATKSKEYRKYFEFFPKRKPRGIPNTYSKELLRNYEKWREEFCAKYDHGIIGGISLFHDLCAYRRQIVNGFGEIHDGLYWGKELEKDFSFASWIISCHNVYMINEKTDDNDRIDSYKSYGLAPLIQNERYAYYLNSKKNPFFLLFCIADSIEPIKRWHDTSLFPKVKLSFANDTFCIDTSNLPQKLSQDYGDAIKEIGTWLTRVDSNINNPHAYEIKL